MTGVITLQLGQLTINRSLNIAGPGAKRLAVSGNHSSRVFNILYSPPGTTVSISDLTITNGRVTGVTGSPGAIGGGTGGYGGAALGGGIYNGATLTLSNCWVVGNTAQGGMGGVGGADDATHRGGTGGDGGLGYGGGIYNGSKLILINCTVSGNSAVGGTGGSGFDAFDNFFLTGGTGGLGGLGMGSGVFDGVAFSMVNCTLSGNSARGGTGGRGGNGFPDDPGGSGGRGQLGQGGGLFSDSISPSFMANCSLSFNSSSGGAGGPGGTGRPGTSPAGLPGTAEGGGLYLRNNTTYFPIIRNSLIAGNSSLASPDLSGDLGSMGYNLIGIVDGVTAAFFISPGDLVGTSATPILPLLGPLQFNGGPVPTMQLLPGSPAIDKGKSPISTDARGRFRPYDFPALVNASGGDGSDIGAFEVGAYEVYPPELSMARSGNNFVL